MKFGPKFDAEYYHSSMKLGSKYDLLDTPQQFEMQTYLLK